MELIGSLHAIIERREHTITRQLALLDQREAALEELTHQHRSAWREVERLRLVCRAAGIEYRTGGAS